MPVALYMDAHIPRAITLGLRMRSVDVLTAQEDGAETLSDPELLERATPSVGRFSPLTMTSWQKRQGDSGRMTTAGA